MRLGKTTHVQKDMGKVCQMHALYEWICKATICEQFNLEQQKQNKKMSWNCTIPNTGKQPIVPISVNVYNKELIILVLKQTLFSIENFP